MIALASLLMVVPAAGPAVPCLPAEVQPGLGSPDPFKPPEPKATELNGAGKTLYRQGKWDEARKQYRAALAADPGFLAPRLNVACSFVRQERFAEATAEVIALLGQAYVPWARELLEAADIGALKVRPEMTEIRRAMAAAAARWGEGLEDSVVFIARQRAPLRVPDKGAGVFILNPHQEVYAFSAATGRYRQLTVEDGHVVAMARTPDRRRLVYVTAEKLVRGTTDDDVALRGVALGELALASMASAPLLRVEGDVRKIEILSTPRGVAYRIDAGAVKGQFLRGDKHTLVPLSDRVRATKSLAVLTARGAMPGSRQVVGGTCPAAVRETGGSEKRAILLSVRGRPPRMIGERYGAGLVGLPIP